VTRFGLALSAFRRHKGRVIFTVLSVAAAFAIFTILAAIEQGLNGNMSMASAQRLDTSTAINAPLPVAYASIIRSVPGVVAVTYISGFFDGYFRDRKDEVAVTALSLPAALKVYPEYIVPEDQKQAFLRDRQGALAGDVLAQKMGWHVGETVPIQGGPPQKNGSTTWFFHIDGIYSTDLPAGSHENLFVNYDYFNEGVAASPTKDTVLSFVELVDDPKNMDRIAGSIDARFATASPDTRTQSVQQESMSYMRQFGDVGAIITWVGLAVFASMLLITGNTMANSVRERMGEFAMMRALGFSRFQITLIVLGESAILSGVGAALGVLAGWGVSKLMGPIMTKILLGFYVPWMAIVLAAALALLFALTTGLLPCRRVANMPVAATLRRA
jgi:putative ABC transport system permease protein